MRRAEARRPARARGARPVVPPPCWTRCTFLVPCCTRVRARAGPMCREGVFVCRLRVVGVCAQPASPARATLHSVAQDPYCACHRQSGRRGPRGQKVELLEVVSVRLCAAACSPRAGASARAPHARHGCRASPDIWGRAGPAPAVPETCIWGRGGVPGRCARRGAHVLAARSLAHRLPLSLSRTPCSCATVAR